MPYIDWNNVELEVDQTWALTQFVDLIRKVNKSAYQKARTSLDVDRRADIDSLMGLRPESPIDAKESLCSLIKALPSNLGFSAFGPSCARYLFIWVGTRTANRNIDLRFEQDGVCAVRLSTGTGKPSRFLEPWCRRLIRVVISDLETATAYYD